MKKPWRTATLVLIAVMTVIRLVFIASSDLSDTEAYYVGWARTLDLSYYDHPPLVAWTTWMVTHLGGHGAFSLRLVTVGCTALFMELLYRLAERMFSARAGFYAVAVVSILPAFAMTSVLVNPEALLAPLWVAFLLLLWDLRDRDEAWRPLLLGVVVGVGFLAKYTALLEVPIALGVVASSPRSRRWLKRPSFWLAGLVALVIVTPVIAWNLERGFPSVRLHLVERAAEWSLAGYATNALHALTAQLTLFHPLVFPGLVACAAITVWRSSRDERFRFLAWTSVPVLLFLGAMMVRVRDAEPHWTMVGYMPLAIVAGACLDAWAERRTFRARALRAYFVTSASLSTALLALYLVHMHTPVLLRRIPVSVYDAAADPFNETLGWAQIRRAVRAQTDSLHGAVVASDHNVLCGHLQVALDDRPSVYCLSPARTEFDFVDRASVADDVPIVYVDTARYPRDPAFALPSRSCTLADNVDVVRAERVVESVHLYVCPAAPNVQASLP